ncbi:caspase family protein [Ponticaulis profundi]|uniref:Caspase family protein n=1 Tax=Ponticaulis profundi TaxID=2665222 RepID=A0ABW1S939_9PROT
MSDQTLKIMCVHGLGGHPGTIWQDHWKAELESAFSHLNGVELDFRFAGYDHLFEDTHISIGEVGEALVKLGWSGLSQVWPFRRRGLWDWFDDLAEDIRYSAGYVVAWVADEDFKARTRKFILNHIADYKPDVLLGHSLGSLITYNALAHPDAMEDGLDEVLAQMRYVTFGSQLNNPFVKKNLTNGRIARLNVEKWYHLFNQHDKVFTAPISLPSARNFVQLHTPFEKAADMTPHSSKGYFNHDVTRSLLWPEIVEDAGVEIAGLPGVRSFLSTERQRPPQRKALLVGINDYASPAIPTLEGCVNDVYEMSAVLQEIGFAPQDIRVCLNDRATTEGILERLAWLLAEAAPGDELLFYCSSHGTRYPEYGASGEPDRFVEALVPYDFDWDEGRAILDRQLAELYAQLSYDTRFVMIFDACNSGGMSRSGGAPKGISPPDDIRHRQLKWDKETQMWVPRSFERITPAFATNSEWEKQMLGQSAACERLGRAASLRGITDQKYVAIRDEQAEIATGPYLPVILSACQESEYAFEYVHGATSYGAFTYSLVNLLRRSKPGSVTFAELVDRTSRQLSELGYDQRPELVGPSAMTEGPLPW